MNENSRIIDADGHIFEDLAAIAAHMPPVWHENRVSQLLGLFPQFDNLHLGLQRHPESAFTDPGVEGWKKFLDVTKVSATVLHPTWGVGFARIIDPDLAVMTARAYNDWLYETYLQEDPRFQAVAMIPLQDPEAAVKELHRAVTELGFVGGLLPANGLGTHLGDRAFWPVYAAAAELGCALSIHGGCQNNLGLDTYTSPTAVHALGHPFGMAISFVGMTFAGVFDQFPSARFAFQEGGLAWFLMVLERMDGSYGGLTPVDPRGRLAALREFDQVSDYIRDKIRTGQLMIGIEGDEELLPWAISRYGQEAFAFATDFPHETNLGLCSEEIDEIAKNEGLDQAAKSAVLFDNAARFYRLSM